MSAPIAAKYATIKARMGAPIKPEVVVRNGGRYMEFEHGVITWVGQGDRAYAVTGPILSRLRQLGIGTTGLGYPISDVNPTVQGRTRLVLQRGTLIAQGSAVLIVGGAINTVFRAAGAEQGALGVPLGQQIPGRNTATPSSSQAFSGGLVVSSSGGTFAMLNGPMLTLWRSMGSELSVMGTPRSTTRRVGASTEMSFANGLFVTTSKGTFSLIGPYATFYRQRGAAGGDLGLPLTSQTRFSHGLYQEFANARVDYVGGRFSLRVKANPSIRAVTANDVKYSYRAGCPVGPAQLRFVQLNYLNYQGRIARGALVLRDTNVQRTVTAFKTAAWAGFPIFQMRLVDAFKGHDPTSMAANNSSAFNCRKVVGNPYAVSPHSYGTAVDVNPVQNPYNDGNKWWPNNGTYWITHRTGQGVLTGTDPMTKALVANGYYWGGWWAAKDWQHFQVNG